MKERLFIAAGLSVGQSERLLLMQRELKEQANSIQLTKPENLHLTLRFIGACDANERQTVVHILERMQALNEAPLYSRILDAGSFSRQEGALFYARLEVSPGVDLVVAELERSLREAGFKPEDKKWLPHVTLARRVFLKCKAVQLDYPQQALESVPCIRLMRSVFTAQGVTYTPVFHWDTGLKQK